MRMKSLILIFIALGCGLVASIGISQVMDRGSSGGSLEVEQILVALSDIDIGAKLDATNVRLEDWPKAKVPEGAVRRLTDVKDKFANSRFFKGEPLHFSKITDQLGNIATKVPQGYRAMPVKVDEDTVMKAISPGDRVDVMVFLRKNLPEIPETGAFTILRNVRVFAVNTNTERATDGKADASNFRTVSLLVKPEHSRELVIAGQLGKIMLTLRRPDESDEDDVEDVTPLEEILSGKSKSASDPAPSGQPAHGQGLLGFMKDNGAFTLPSSASQGEPQWKMLVLGPTETQQFEWHDTKSLPLKSSFGNPGEAPASNTGGGPVSPSTGHPIPTPPAPVPVAPQPEALSDPEARPNSPKQPKLPLDGSEKK
jgi:pilus assembly protein CpaB